MIRTLYQQSEWRSRMGQTAAKTALAWTWDRNAKDTWELLKEASGKKTPL